MTSTSTLDPLAAGWEDETTLLLAHGEFHSKLEEAKGRMIAEKAIEAGLTLATAKAVASTIPKDPVFIAGRSDAQIRESIEKRVEKAIGRPFDPARYEPAPDWSPARFFGWIRTVAA